MRGFEDFNIDTYKTTKSIQLHPKYFLMENECGQYKKVTYCDFLIVHENFFSSLNVNVIDVIDNKLLPNF